MIGMTRANAVNAFGNLRFHWPEYLMEAGELGLYMFSTCAIASLLQHPASPVRHVIANSFFQSGRNAHVLSIGKDGLLRCGILRCRATHWRDKRCRDRYISAAGCAG